LKRVPTAGLHPVDRPGKAGRQARIKPAIHATANHDTRCRSGALRPGAQRRTTTVAPHSAPCGRTGGGLLSLETRPELLQQMILVSHMIK
jgi:hypothetical protein